MVLSVALITQGQASWGLLYEAVLPPLLGMWCQKWLAYGWEVAAEEAELRGCW